MIALDFRLVDLLIMVRRSLLGNLVLWKEVVLVLERSLVAAVSQKLESFLRPTHHRPLALIAHLYNLHGFLVTVMFVLLH